MEDGEVIRTKTVKAFFENEDCSGWVSYSAGRKRRIVLLVLGDESEGPEDRLDPVAAMKSFGWTPPPDLIVASGIDTRSAIDAKRRGPKGESPTAATSGGDAKPIGGRTT